MFGTKYTRLKFWIISIILLIPTTFINTITKALESNGKDVTFGYIAIILLSVIWLSTLANRIRDYNSNPWIALWAIVPLANIILTFYYGIVQYKKTNE